MLLSEIPDNSTINDMIPKYLHDMFTAFGVNDLRKIGRTELFKQIVRALSPSPAAIVKCTYRPNAHDELLHITCNREEWRVKVYAWGKWECLGHGTAYTATVVLR